MPFAQQILARLGAAADWIQIDDLARIMDIERVLVRAALLTLYSRKQVETEGDRWRAAAQGEMP